MSMPMEVKRCGKGLSEVEGQCVPVPTVVFRQCMEAFRTQSVERDRGKELSIGATARGYGEAKIHHGQQDALRKQFAGAVASDSEVVVQECRRQEQAERQSQLAQAWAAANDSASQASAALADAKAARRDLERAEADVEELRARQEASAADLDELQEALDQAQADLAAATARATANDPCAVGPWPACADAAAAAHVAGDYPRAHERYAAACAADQGRACGNWGLLFEQGLGVPADGTKARVLFRKGCDLQDMNACSNLGHAQVDDPAIPFRDEDR